MSEKSLEPFALTSHREHSCALRYPERRQSLWIAPQSKEISLLKKKKNTVTVNSVILMSLGYFYLFISTRIYENRVIHLPCLSLFTVLFAYVASFISCFVVRDLCSISTRFRVLSNPPLPPSLPP